MAATRLTHRMRSRILYHISNSLPSTPPRENPETAIKDKILDALREQAPSWVLDAMNSGTPYTFNSYSMRVPGAAYISSPLVEPYARAGWGGFKAEHPEVAQWVEARLAEHTAPIEARNRFNNALRRVLDQCTLVWHFVEAFPEYEEHVGTYGKPTRTKFSLDLPAVAAVKSARAEYLSYAEVQHDQQRAA